MEESTGLMVTELVPFLPRYIAKCCSALQCLFGRATCLVRLLVTITIVVRQTCLRRTQPCTVCLEAGTELSIRLYFKRMHVGEQPAK
jgi:hypothetical protein